MRLEFLTNLSLKVAPEYYQLVLNILCDLIFDVINYCV